jgi:hypothetical protein
MRQFPASPITALIDGRPRYYLGESMACDLTVADLLGPDGLASLAEVNLGYGTSAGDPALRAPLAARLGIRDDQVLITAGAARGRCSSSACYAATARSWSGGPASRRRSTRCTALAPPW